VAYLFAFVVLDLFAYKFKQLQAVVAWYPPAGLTYVLLLVFGAKFMPVVTIALLIDSLFVFRMPQPLYVLILWFLGISSIYCLAASFLRRKIKMDWQLRKLRDVIWLVTTVVITSALLAVLSIVGSTISSPLPRNDIFPAILIWWVGETIGALTIAPFLLVWVVPWLKNLTEGHQADQPKRRMSPRSSLLVFSQMLSILIMLYWVFSEKSFSSFGLYIFFPCLSSGLP
jgi:integral membrane sensor domain MASE1